MRGNALSLDAVTHKMKTVLTYLGGYASMLSMEGPLNEEQSRYVTKILQAVDQMSHLICQINVEPESHQPPLEAECIHELPHESERG